MTQTTPRGAAIRRIWDALQDEMLRETGRSRRVETMAREPQRHDRTTPRFVPIRLDERDGLPSLRDSVYRGD